MPKKVVEIHVPLTAAAGPTDAYPFPWIDDVQDFLEYLDEQGDVHEYDDGEEDGDVYIFFITGGSESALLRVASQVATLDRVPAGAFAIVTDDQAEEFGMGRRVALPLSPTSAC
ncbi:hypothetical protein [Micromonospora mirobrigensis]|uniref:Uncharacterized protein n=1 Tax=Micromonospora mirobrigensis TaxID=262898 RepID=A0A1C4YXC7_9ACTN|nr:hypothetical protein [Micromonospora mirobrigensis]SCF25277.1 hypothetical protein GA0070564_104483 [Micromonospora mirobrigensis]